MSVAFASPKRTTEWLRNHRVSGRKNFQWRGSLRRYYLIQDPDPDAGYWFGYDKNEDAFFLTDNVPNNFRTQILRMECGRLNLDKNQTHLTAVKRVAEGPSDRSTKPFLTFLRTLYKEWADKYAPLNELELTDEQQDIIDTAQYLESQTKE